MHEFKMKAIEEKNRRKTAKDACALQRISNKDEKTFKQIMGFYGKSTEK